jgi:hypothetical protein
MAGRPCTVLLWVRPGQAAPPGYYRTGVVSRWPHTGRVRATLWERQESAHVGPCGAAATESARYVVMPPDGGCVAPTPIYREGEKRT